jgi:hypothetical protein
MGYRNFTRNPFTAQNNSVTVYERCQIPASAPYYIDLKELPEYNSTTTTKVYFISDNSQLTEVFANPSASEFWVDYPPDSNVASIENREGTGRILFNSADAGKYIIVQYDSIGKKTNVDDIYLYNNSEIDIRLWAETTVNRRLTLHSWMIDEDIFFSTYVDSSGNYKIGIQWEPFYERTGGAYPTLTSGVVAATPTALNLTQRVHFGLSTDKYAYLIYKDTGNTNRTYTTSTALKTVGGLTWSTYTEPSDFCEFAASVQIGNYLYMFGTNSVSATVDNNALKWNIETGATTALTNVTVNWKWGTAVHDGGNYIYLIGNRSTDDLNTCYKYDIINDSYTALSAVSTDIHASPYFFNRGGFYTDDDQIIMPWIESDGFSLNQYAWVYDVGDSDNQYLTLTPLQGGNEGIHGGGDTRGFDAPGLDSSTNNEENAADNPNYFDDMYKFKSGMLLERHKGVWLPFWNDFAGGELYTNIYGWRNPRKFKDSIEILTK